MSKESKISKFTDWIMRSATKIIFLLADKKTYSSVLPAYISVTNQQKAKAISYYYINYSVL